MIVTLSSLTFDLSGFITLDVNPSSLVGTVQRRNNRIATLDGGAVLNDFGFSEADRTITLEWSIKDKATEDLVLRFVKLYSKVRLSMPEGLFLASVFSYTQNEDESSMVLEVLEKIT